jgi:putative phosphoesterase
LLKLLIIGDLHIPERASSIQKPIMDKIGNERFDFVLCTGDLTDEGSLKFLSNLGKLYAVQGNMDLLALPRSAKIEAEAFTIGLIHGDTVHPRGSIKGLANEAQRMNVDIIVSGHTHRLSINEANVNSRELLLLDPGSATGCWSGGPASFTPSFIMLEIAGNEATVHSYVLKGEVLKKSIIKFRAQTNPTS